MAWTAPRTWSANAVLTAAQLNQHLRDNLNELLPAVASESGEWYSVSTANNMVGRVVKSTTVGRQERTSSTTYTSLQTTGPSVTLTTGPMALVFMRCALENTLADNPAIMSYEITGATTSTGTSVMDARSITTDGVQANQYWRIGGISVVDLTPGENTFNAKYRCGGSGTSTFSARFLAVLAF